MYRGKTFPHMQHACKIGFSTVKEEKIEFRKDILI